MDTRSRMVALVGLLAALAGCRTLPPAEPPPVMPPPPPLTVEAPATYEYFPYEVKKGDTLYSLGERFKVGWREIAQTNNLVRYDQLPEGKLLLIRKVEGVEPPELAPAVRPRAEAPVPRRPVPAANLHRGKPSAEFWWPTAGQTIRHFEDVVRGLPEPGIAIAAAAGTEVYAVAGGTVILCQHAAQQSEPAWGNVVVLSHANNMASWYAHLDAIFVENGSTVKKGEPIGTVGSSGEATRPQLAFRLYRDERPIDPERRLP